METDPELSVSAASNQPRSVSTPCCSRTCCGCIWMNSSKVSSMLPS